MIGPAALIGFLNPRNLALLGGVVIVGSLLWWGKGFVEEKFALEREVFAQSQQIQSMQARERILKTVAESQAAANEVAQRLLVEERERFAELSTARQIVNTAEDGPLAPVLSETLDALRARQEPVEGSAVEEDTE